MPDSSAAMNERILMERMPAIKRDLERAEEEASRKPSGILFRYVGQPDDGTEMDDETEEIRGI